MDDPQIVVAILASLAALTVAVLGLLGVVIPLLIQTRRHARRADDQVSNDHSTNLREESDSRHDDNRRSLASLSLQLNEVAGSVRGVQRDVGRLWDADVDHQHRIRDLEETIPKAEYDQLRSAARPPFPRRRDLREAGR